MEPLIDGYLSDLDALAALAAVDCGDYAPTYDVWLAMQLAAGRPREDVNFCDYLDACRDAATWQAWDALTYFGAVDDDDYIPDEVNHDCIDDLRTDE